MAVPEAARPRERWQASRPAAGVRSDAAADFPVGRVTEAPAAAHRVEAEPGVPHDDLAAAHRVGAEPGVPHDDLAAAHRVGAEPGVPHDELVAAHWVEAEPGVPHD